MVVKGANHARCAPPTREFRTRACARHIPATRENRATELTRNDTVCRHRELGAIWQWQCRRAPEGLVCDQRLQVPRDYPSSGCEKMDGMRRCTFREVAWETASGLPIALRRSELRLWRLGCQAGTLHRALGVAVEKSHKLPFEPLARGRKWKRGSNGMLHSRPQAAYKCST